MEPEAALAAEARAGNEVVSTVVRWVVESVAVARTGAVGAMAVTLAAVSAVAVSAVAVSAVAALAAVVSVAAALAVAVSVAAALAVAVSEAAAMLVIYIPPVSRGHRRPVSRSLAA